MQTLTHEEAKELLKRKYAKLEDLKNYLFPEELLDQYSHQFKEKDWNSISRHQILSEAFIEKFSHKINWFCVSKYQKLSENFIEKHYNKMYWYEISQFQKLSFNFIIKYPYKISTRAIQENQNIDQQTKELLQTTLKLSS
jgi:hypothetical protein